MQALERLHPTRARKPGLIARWEDAYARHGTLTFSANFAVASGRVIAPTLGPTRTEDDCARHLAMPLDTDPAASWLFVADQLNMHKSASVVRLIAERCNLDVALGVKGQSGILPSMATRAAFLPQTDHRMRVVFPPKHTSWLHQVEMWLSAVS